LDPDPEVAGLMISHLEHLRLREKIFQQLNTFLVDNGLRNVNALLARLYLRNGRKDEARKLLNDQFQCAMELLGYDLRWNYEFGYGALAALLFLNGQLENAEVALSLKRFFLLGFDSERKKRRENAPERTKNESDLNAAEPKDGRGEGEQTPTDTQDERALCTNGYSCENGSGALPFDATLYSCTTCYDVTFCETCYNNLCDETGQRKLFICSHSHEFIKTPPAGLERIEEPTITINGKSISYVDWLAEVRRNWKTGLCFKS
jgi:hypothetical protein